MTREPSAPATPPVPLSAVFTVSTERLAIEFDQAVIVSGAPTMANLTARRSSGLAGTYRWTGNVSQGVTCVFQMGSPVPPAGFPPQASYHSSPPQLHGSTGLPVAPFVIPMTEA